MCIACTKLTLLTTDEYTVTITQGSIYDAKTRYVIQFEKDAQKLPFVEKTVELSPGLFAPAPFDASDEIFLADVRKDLGQVTEDVTISQKDKWAIQDVKVTMNLSQPDMVMLSSRGQTNIYTNPPGQHSIIKNGYLALGELNDELFLVTQAVRQIQSRISENPWHMVMQEQSKLLLQTAEELLQSSSH